MNLVQETPDWNLPNFHETYYTEQFLQGGRTFIDIGAHVGTWTLRLAPLFKRVFAFEPDPRASDALLNNVMRAGLTNVEVLPAAVSDKTGTAKLMLTPNPCTNTMFWAESLRTDANLGEVDVHTIALDEWVDARGIDDIDFIKMDAEGAELLIVQGARETFLTQRPDFFIEMHGLFWKRLRRMLDPLQCDVIDGGRSGLSLVKHRDDWPGFKMPDYMVYQHPQAPTAQQYEELRRLHGIPEESCKAPLSGWLSEGG